MWWCSLSRVHADLPVAFSLTPCTSLPRRLYIIAPPLLCLSHPTRLSYVDKANPIKQQKYPGTVFIDAVLSRPVPARRSVTHALHRPAQNSSRPYRSLWSFLFCFSAPLIFFHPQNYHANVLFVTVQRPHCRA